MPRSTTTRWARAINTTLDTEAIARASWMPVQVATWPHSAAPAAVEPIRAIW